MFSVRVLGSKPYSILARNFSIDRPGWISVLDDPKIKSPFDNPRRTIASPLPLQETSSRPIVFTENNVEDLAKHSDDSVTEPLKNSDWNVESTKQSKIIESENQSSARELVLEDVSAATTSVNKARKNGIFTLASQKLGLYIDPDLPDKDKAVLRTTRATKAGCFIVFGGIIIGFVVFCVTNGKAKRDELGQLVSDKYSGMWLAPFYRITDAMYSWKEYITEPIRDKLLPEPLQYPYHQPKYTIVIEMKNILVNPEWTYKTGHRFKKRPALDYFLDVVGYPQFELVLYTSESQVSASPVVQSIDPSRKIMYHLFRECNKLMDGYFVKDLSRLNRDLSKVIYIDCDPNSYKLHPDNVLRVRKWEGDMDDTALVDLAELIKTIYISDVDDVRPILQYYSQFEDPAAEFRRRASMLVQQNEQVQKSDADQGQLKRLTTNSFFGRRQYV